MKRAGCEGKGLKQTSCSRLPWRCSAGASAAEEDDAPAAACDDERSTKERRNGSYVLFVLFFELALDGRHLALVLRRSTEGQLELGQSRL